MRQSRGEKWDHAATARRSGEGDLPMNLRLRSRWTLLGVAAILTCAYALAGFLGVPRLARSQLEALVTRTLERRIELGEIRFNPFTFEATIEGLRLTEADGAPLAAFRHLRVNAGIASLWRRGLVLQEIELAAPELDVVVAPDGSLNLARLAPPAAAGADKPRAEARPLRVHIGRLAVAQGRLGFQDRSRSQPFAATLSPIEFSLEDFRTDVGHRNAYSFAGATAAGEKLEWTGAFTVQPLGSGGEFSVRDLQLATLDSYLGDALPAKLASGTVELAGSYRFELEPLSLELTLPALKIRDLSLTERAATGKPPVTVPQIDVQGVAVSLARRDIGVQRLDVRGARIELAREADGSLSLTRLATATKPQSQSSGLSEKPWTVHADVIAVEDAAVLAEDRTISPSARLKLAPIRLAVNDWTTAPGRRFALDAQVGIEGGGALSARGAVGLQPLAAELAIDLQRFPLAALQPYIAQATAMTLHSGRLGAKGQLDLASAADGQLASKVSGELRIDDLRTTDTLLREDFVKWRALAVTGIRFQQHPDRLRIERIVAREPYARVVIAKDGGLNVASVLAPRKEAPGKEPSQPGARLPISIGTVQIVGGSANFADYSVQPSFATGIVALGGQVSGLSSAPESRAKVALKGRVDEYSPVELTGEVNLLSADVYTRLALDFRNIELASFNPYSGKFAGYNISKGKLSTQMSYHVEARKLYAKHHIVVDNLEFGDKTDSKDAAPIPIKFGVALLKDKRGVIELDLPVSGTLDDPEFRLGPLIWKAVVGLLSKIVTAPFKALGALFGGGEELAFVEFAPGSAGLTDASRSKLGTLAKSLVERPQLRLNVPFTMAPVADADIAARQALHALVPPADPGKPFDDVAKRKRLDALEVVYRARLKTVPAYPAQAQGGKERLDAQLGWIEATLLDQLKPAPAALEALARERAAAVRDALLVNKELDPQRVFIVSKPLQTEPAAGAVRMEMKLE